MKFPIVRIAALPFIAVLLCSCVSNGTKVGKSAAIEPPGTTPAVVVLSSTHPSELPAAAMSGYKFPPKAAVAETICPSASAVGSLLGFDTPFRVDPDSRDPTAIICSYGIDKEWRTTRRAMVSWRPNADFAQERDSIIEYVNTPGSAEGSQVGLESGPEPLLGENAWRESTTYKSPSCWFFVGTPSGTGVMTVHVDGAEGDDPSGNCTIALRLMRMVLAAS